MLVAQPRNRQSRRQSGSLRLALYDSAPQSRVERARSAGAAFVRGATLGWSGRALASWFVCQYAPSVVPATDAGGELLGPASERVLDDGMSERIILHAHATVLKLLRDLVVPERASPIARVALATGSVLGLRDARGGVAYSPVALDGLYLGERVASLFVADYLTRPQDYRWLMTCAECGELAFSQGLVHARWCEATAERWPLKRASV